MGEESPKLAGAPSGAVFLSYASQDAEAARRISNALRAAGIEVWFDQSELRGGDVWDQRIRQQLRDCALFIPVISANTASRHEGYFRLEWDLADQRSHMIARDRAFIVPVCVDGTPDSGTDVPESFLRVQWTRLAAGETPPGFVQRISTLLSSGTPVAAARARLPAGAASGAPSSWRFQSALLLIATVAVIGLGYLAVDKLVLSKRATGTGQASAQVAQGVTPAQSAAPEKSIAVLPFVDMSEKHDQEYFGDGMAEGVLDTLARIPQLKVIGRTSSFQFKGRSEDLRAIGEKLGAAYVVEGSVRTAGARMRVTAQLIDTHSGTRLWADGYDRDSGDVLILQDQLATSIARALQLAVVSDEARPSRRLPDPEAYTFYLRGRAALDRGGGGPEEREAISDFEQSAAQPRDPLALYLSAWLAFDLGRHDEARRLQDASLAIDPLNPESYNNSGWIYYLTGDLDGAERAFRKSLEISPSYDNDHLMLGQILVLQGNPGAALAEMEAESGRVDHEMGLALVYHALGRRAESDAAVARLAGTAGDGAAVNLAELHAYRGERDQAFEWLEKSVAARELNLVHKIKDEPMLASLRSDPRYPQLLREMKLSP